MEKMKATGGGSLTKQEKRLVQSTAYQDLVLKLGISATGNEARSDSDALSTKAPVEPPNQRLTRVFSQFANDEDASGT